MKQEKLSSRKALEAQLVCGLVSFTLVLRSLFMFCIFLHDGPETCLVDYKHTANTITAISKVVNVILRKFPMKILSRRKSLSE